MMVRDCWNPDYTTNNKYIAGNNFSINYPKHGSQRIHHYLVDGEQYIKIISTLTGLIHIHGNV